MKTVTNVVVNFIIFFYLVNINVHSFGLFERQQSVVIVDLDAV